jgi:hypothetical protein
MANVFKVQDQDSITRLAASGWSARIVREPTRWRAVLGENRKLNFERFPYAIIYSVRREEDFQSGLAPASSPVLLAAPAVPELSSASDARTSLYLGHFRRFRAAPGQAKDRAPLHSSGPIWGKRH